MTEETQPSTLSMLEQAKQANEQLSKNIAELREERKRLEELKAITILGGGTDAGQAQEKKPELTPKEYAKMVMNGGLNK